ncbi:ABC transporter ATP-binding protein [Flexivirga oryzae]|uniref:ABC-2 type transport system ATP-binding protein n=1 Tax=Flexivirga oryzae TaxID=1794944 RepID=A0A839NHW6_9MICO|nr:ABC transporter ATP-binding protein [Flexivirga oryzae]MBB2892636.1 ABC-2 type transport system ATP-binding protein [Flexivirga oryzae]MBB2894685.1 ABC-2 type transport system ATP-binding protein [Flexivirga oryzae]
MTTPSTKARAVEQSPTTNRVIEVVGLTKTFGRFRAIDGLDLAVSRGTVHGFLGPNGAGKTTTIRVLLGLYGRDAGVVRVLGRDPATDSATVNRQVSYVAGEVALWPTLTGRQALDALAGLRRSAGGDYDDQRESALIEAFALDTSKRIRKYSKGNRQKVMLVAAFAANTELLILDEPTSGLDPLMERTFGECVEQATSQGRTVLLSSHILGEVEQLCDAVTIIKDGRLVETGQLSQMRHLAASTISAVLSGDVADRVVDEVQDVLGTRVEVARKPLSDGKIRVEASVPQEAVDRVLQVLLVAHPTDVRCTPASLEDLFLRHYKVAAR